jgi:hypothetical protein
MDSAHCLTSSLQRLYTCMHTALCSAPEGLGIMTAAPFIDQAFCTRAMHQHHCAPGPHTSATVHQGHAPACALVKRAALHAESKFLNLCGSLQPAAALVQGPLGRSLASADFHGVNFAGEHACAKASNKHPYSSIAAVHHSAYVHTQVLPPLRQGLMHACTHA